MKIEEDIQDFLRQVTDRDLLFGDCESAAHLSATQEHILMLLAADDRGELPMTNAKIADRLHLSAAAVTKALKKLTAAGLIRVDRNPEDEREQVLQLTAAGQPIAQEHAHHHAKTLAVYKKVAKKFSKKEQATIRVFLRELEEALHD